MSLMPKVPLIRHESGYLLHGKSTPADRERKREEWSGPANPKHIEWVSFIDLRIVLDAERDIWEHAGVLFELKLDAAVDELGYEGILAPGGYLYDALGFVEISQNPDKLDTRPLWNFVAEYVGSGRYRRDAEEVIAVAMRRNALVRLGLAREFDQFAELPVVTA